MTRPIPLLTGDATLELATTFRDAGYLPDLEQHLITCSTCGQIIIVDGVQHIQWCETGAPMIAYARELARREQQHQKIHEATEKLLDKMAQTPEEGAMDP